jgi:hypothetical protein
MFSQKYSSNKENSVGNGQFLLVFRALDKTSISEPAMAQQNVESGIVVNQDF